MGILKIIKNLFSSAKPRNPIPLPRQIMKEPMERGIEYDTVMALKEEVYSNNGEITSLIISSRMIVLENTMLKAKKINLKTKEILKKFFDENPNYSNTDVYILKAIISLENNNIFIKGYYHLRDKLFWYRMKIRNKNRKTSN